jgi:hypothetical protein
LGIITLVPEEKEEAQGSPLPAAAVTARDVVEAAKNGYEYRQSDKDKTWTLIKKQPQTVMKVHPEAVNSPEMLKVVQVFHLKPGLTKYELEVDKLDPYPVNFPPEGVTVLDLETRSLLQVLYFISKGVDVPLEHLSCGRVRVTTDAAGQAFDWHQVTDGLFRVYSVRCHKRPPSAHVAIRYLDYWYYIDDTDQDTKATFSLVMELARLELTGKSGGGPALTLSVGGR